MSLLHNIIRCWWFLVNPSNSTYNYVSHVEIIIILSSLSSLQEHVWQLAIMNVATVLVETVQAVLRTVSVTPSAVSVVIAVVISEIPALVHAGLLASIPALVHAWPLAVTTVVIVKYVLGSLVDSILVTVIPHVEAWEIAATTWT